jgi:hypothetical protein
VQAPIELVDDLEDAAAHVETYLRHLVSIAGDDASAILGSVWEKIKTEAVAAADAAKTEADKVEAVVGDVVQEGKALVNDVGEGLNLTDAAPAPAEVIPPAAPEPVAGEVSGDVDNAGTDATERYVLVLGGEPATFSTKKIFDKLVAGDVFQLFDADGTQIFNDEDNSAVFVATNDAYRPTPDADWTVDTTAYTGPASSTVAEALTTTEISVLETAELSALTTTQIDTLTTTELAPLASTEISGLTTTDISSLATTQVAELATTQIDAQS